MQKILLLLCNSILELISGNHHWLDNPSRTRHLKQEDVYIKLLENNLVYVCASYLRRLKKSIRRVKNYKFHASLENSVETVECDFLQIAVITKSKRQDKTACDDFYTEILEDCL